MNGVVDAADAAARRRVQRGLRLLAALPLWLLAVVASAHTGGVTGYAALQAQDHVVRYTLTLSSLPQALLTRHAGDAQQALEAARTALRERLTLTHDGAVCVAAAASASPATATKISVSITVDYACPAPVSAVAIRDDSFDVLGADLHVLGRATRGDVTREFTLAFEARDARIDFGDLPAADEPPATSGFVAYLMLGIEHILIGYDHLLFLLALLLAGGSIGTMVRIVTAFTVAHSITLALTVLDVLRVPADLVEALIAASIAWVAAENLWATRPLSRRVWITAAFGLVHGCGFASVLREIGLPVASAWSALAGFNLGVECGQLAVIALLVPALRGLARVDPRQRMRRGLSAALCATGASLLVARMLGV